MRLIAILLVCCWGVGLRASVLHPAEGRTREDDLEVRGGRVEGFLSWESVAALPGVQTHLAPLDWLDGEHRIEALPLEALVRALGGDPTRQTVVTDSADGYQSHFSPQVIADAKPIVVLRIGGLPPKEWPRGGLPFWPGPFFISVIPSLAPEAAADRFASHKRPFAVTRLRLMQWEDYTRGATPTVGGEQMPLVARGRALFEVSCASCHNVPGGMGGGFAQRNTLILATYAQAMPDYFNGYVRNPKASRADARMPAQPDVTDAELDGLRAYLAALHPQR
jgi:mono/diheme cytochrome c family protein